jgi:hypothetical protein
MEGLGVIALEDGAFLIFWVHHARVSQLPAFFGSSPPASSVAKGVSFGTTDQFLVTQW